MDRMRGDRDVSEAEPTAPRPTAGRGERLAARYGAALAQALPERGDRAPTIHDAATAAVDHRSAGRAVDGDVAAQVGAHLGADLSAVQVHDDALSQQANTAMGARAFAYGADVYLGAGESDRDLGLMAHELTHVVQQGAAGRAMPQRQVEVGAADSPAEREADAVAAAVTGGATPAALLVDDGPVAPGQMLKSTFLAQLHEQVHAAADAELGWLESTLGCPYIDLYFQRYAGRPAGDAEALLKRFAPAARSARTATDLLAPVVARVREGVRHWRDRGQAPPELAALDGTAAALAESHAQAARPPAEATTDGEETALAARAPLPGQPEELTARLGPGVAPTGRVAEIADTLGVSALRVHDGPAAAALAERADAHAFALGSHVVFGAAALRPGTVEGDALIAHEVAHVAQQTGAASAGDAVDAVDAEVGGQAEAVLPGRAGGEGDADRAAGGVLARLYGGARAAASTVWAGARAPVELARCSKSDKKPEVKGPEIEATREATGQHIVDGMGSLNTGGSLDTGIHYSHNYEARCRREDPSRWKDDYRKGYANPTYWTRTGFMQWKLKPGVSASAAVKDWLTGLTIAECLSTVRVLQVDAMRATLGDTRFDQLFGGVEGTPEKELLSIGVGQTTITDYRENVAPPEAGTIGDRPAVLGGQYYFTNHPKYLLKHPGGAWQGENAVYLGKQGGVQKWSGFGADAVTEDGMLDEMVRAYNRARDANDQRRLDEIKSANGGTLPAEYDVGGFPDQITKADILSAPAYTIGSTTRKGGFNAGNGLALDLDKVKGLAK